MLFGIVENALLTAYLRPASLQPMADVCTGKIEDPKGIPLTTLKVLGFELMTTSPNKSYKELMVK